MKGVSCRWNYEASTGAILRLKLGWDAASVRWSVRWRLPPIIKKALLITGSHRLARILMITVDQASTDCCNLVQFWPEQVHHHESSLYVIY